MGVADGSPPADDKEVPRSCPGCGGIVPPSRGFKPRKFCSPKCGRRFRKPSKPASVPCLACGKEVEQNPRSRGRSKKYCSRRCQDATYYKARHKSATIACRGCGKSFRPLTGGRKYCSPLCKENYLKKPATCVVCGKQFRTANGGRTCSRKCQGKPKAKPASCLRCGRVFTRRRTAAGNYANTARMYCGRDCAFAHKTERSAWRKLGNWFSKWGDDVWPMLVKCQCGETHNVFSPSGDKTCIRCRHIDNRRGPCEECGQEIDRRNGVRFCRECVGKRWRDANRKSRRRHRRIHGHESNNRQRCRKYGAHYEPVSRKFIFERDKWTCQICNCKLLPQFSLIVGTKQVNPRSPTIDHKIPLCEGPSGPGHTPDNCQAACWGCNTERGAKPLHSFAASKATGLH